MSVDRQGRPLPLPGLAPGLIPGRPGVTRRRAARDRHPRRCLDLRFCSRVADQADGRHWMRTRSPLWTRGRPACHLYLQSVEVTRSCFRGPRMARAATSRSSRVRKTSRDLRAVGWSADGTRFLFTEVPTRSPLVLRWRSPSTRPSARRMLMKQFGPTTRPSLQTDTGWPINRDCVRSNPRFMSSGIRSSAAGNRFRRTAAVFPSGRMMAGNCSSAAWTSADVCRRDAVRDYARRRARAGVVRTVPAPPIQARSRSVRHRPRWTVPHHAR